MLRTEELEVHQLQNAPLMTHGAIIARSRKNDALNALHDLHELLWVPKRHLVALVQHHHVLLLWLEIRDRVTIEDLVFQPTLFHKAVVLVPVPFHEVFVAEDQVNSLNARLCRQ